MEYKMLDKRSCQYEAGPLYAQRNICYFGVKLILYMKILTVNMYFTSTFPKIQRKGSCKKP